MLPLRATLEHARVDIDLAKGLLARRDLAKSFVKRFGGDVLPILSQITEILLDRLLHFVGLIVGQARLHGFRVRVEEDGLVKRLERRLLLLGSFYESDSRCKLRLCVRRFGGVGRRLSSAFELDLLYVNEHILFTGSAACIYWRLLLPLSQSHFLALDLQRALLPSFVLLGMPVLLAPQNIGAHEVLVL